MFFSPKDSLVTPGQILAYLRAARKRIPKAITALEGDYNSSAKLGAVVGMMVGMMAVSTGHRKGVFLSLTEEEVRQALLYGKTYTIRVSLFSY